ncbi:MAG: septum formation initiator family protein [Lachnospiraceae bacterium]|nr:septum formation initiator family protein [Clostridium sp.]MDY4821290.1 septum formation initiator family protein [Lachnospiraceae bacterium]MED9806339.1 septum formation initiator family protein [Lachnospiraceae bacterium]
MSMFLVSLVVVMILVAVGVRSISLKEKGAEYDATIASLEKQIEEENVRTREIKEFEDYTKTNAYVEQIAHSKLGLVYPDETIFIDKDE